MIPYILMILIPILFLNVSLKRNKDSKWAVHIGNGDYSKENNIAVPIFFVILFVFLAFRNESVGIDLLNYKYIYEYHGVEEFRNLLSCDLDILYKLLNWLCQKANISYQLFLAIVAGICIWPIAKLYNKDNGDSYLKIILFVNMSTFVMMFSGLRQSIAMALGLIAYKCVKEKKLFWFLVIAIIALGFHHTAFMIFLMYPIYYLKLKQTHLVMLIPVIGLLLVFNTQIFSALSNVFAIFSARYENIQITSTGAFGSLLLFGAFALIAFILPDNEKLNKEIQGMRNFLILTVIIQCFAPINTLVMRLNYYYILFIPILMAKILEIPKDCYTKLAKELKICLILFFFVYFVITMYKAYVTGDGALGIVPYIPFWKG